MAEDPIIEVDEIYKLREQKKTLEETQPKLQLKLNNQKKEIENLNREIKRLKEIPTLDLNLLKNKEKEINE